MRCRDCNKFVPYGEPRTDDIEVEVGELDGTVTLRGPLYLTCEQCGGDLKSCDMEAEEDAASHFENIEEDDNTKITFEANGNPDIEATDRTQTTDDNGKPIKNKRGMKRFYGVSATVVVSRKVVRKGEDGKETEETSEATITLESEEQASAFDEC